MINICDQANYYDALTRITKRNPNYKTAVMLLQLIDENGVHYNSSKCKEEDKKLIKLYDIVSKYVQIVKEYRYSEGQKFFVGYKVVGTALPQEVYDALEKEYKNIAQTNEVLSV